MVLDPDKLSHKTFIGCFQSLVDCSSTLLIGQGLSVAEDQNYSAYCLVTFDLSDKDPTVQI